MYDAIKEIVLRLMRLADVPPESPPGSSDKVQVFRAAPAFLHYRFVGLFVLLGVVGLGWLVGAVAALIVFWPIGLLVLLLFVVIYVPKCILLYATTRLDYDMRYYMVSDRSLRIVEGVWVRREITLTFANVQNLAVEQGPLQRYFGISDLAVQTAGGGGAAAQQQNPFDAGHKAALEGIANPQEVRDMILDLLRSYRGAGLGDPDDRDHHAPATETSLPPAALAALRDVRDEVRAWRSALGGTSAAARPDKP